MTLTPAAPVFRPRTIFRPLRHLPASPVFRAPPDRASLVLIVIAVYVWTLWRRFMRAEQDLKTLAARLTPPR